MTAAPLPSIRQRINRVLVGIALVWVVTMSVGAGWFTHHVLDDLLDDALRESAQVLYALVLRARDHDTAHEQGMLPAPPHIENLVWQLTDASGAVVLRSHRAPEAPLSELPHEGFEITRDWHVFTMPLGDGRGLLRVAQREAGRQALIALTMAGAMGMTALIGALAAWWLNRGLRRELQPLLSLSDQVAALEPTTPPTQRIEARRQELKPLVEAIDGLTERLGQRLAQERALAAHAAHALRTPLAGMDAQLAVALKEAPPSLQPRLRQTREAAARLRRVVTALISLFRTGGELHWQATSLSQLLSRLPLSHVSVQTSGSDTLPADPDLLSAALSNLLDNAVRHGATEVHVNAELTPESVTLTVRDNGSGMPAEQGQRLQAALDAQRTEDGLGLGLTLADMVARTHGGRLRIEPPPPHGGTAITLRWPHPGLSEPGDAP